MARGIITVKPSTGGTTAGRIVLTDGSPGSTTTITAGDSSGATTTTKIGPALAVGTSISFTEIIKANISDIVDFIYDVNGVASGINLVSAGTLVTGTYTDNIVVASGQSVLLSAANFDGKIIVNGGILALTDSTHAEGKIESSSAGSFVIIDTCTIEGKIEVTNAGNLIMQNTTVEGKISSNGNAFASVTGCTIKGNLEILNASQCFSSNNTVVGSANTPNCKS
jgi:hypothetical protein